LLSHNDFERVDSGHEPPLLARLVYGKAGLRAGWRLLIFAALLSAFFALNRLILIGVAAAGADQNALFVAARLLIFVAFLLASSIMGRIEGRTLADYGLPWRLTDCSSSSSEVIRSATPNSGARRLAAIDQTSSRNAYRSRLRGR
jgi:hypothetical protein